MTVSLDETAMKVDNATIPLTPGMTVTVEIRTDSRRVIDYLLSPLAKIGSEARQGKVGRASVRELSLAGLLFAIIFCKSGTDQNEPPV